MPANNQTFIQNYCVKDTELFDIESLIEGHHIKAARALLKWSMQDLARASNLSLSTVRRLEDDGCSGGRSLDNALDALRQAGIRFGLMDRTMIALARAG